MENDSIGQYRSHDPPKNFTLRVTFWKVTPGSVVPTHLPPLNPETLGKTEIEMAVRQPNEEKEEVLIHWQEKFFSQREYDFYGDPLNCITSLEQKYHEDVENIKRTLGDRPNKRVFTYIDGDSFTVLKELTQMTLNEDDYHTVLVERMSKLKHGNALRKPPTAPFGLRRRNIVVEEPTEAMRNNHVITTPCKTMQVMLDLGFVDRFGYYVEDERMVCTIKMDAHGLIVIKPDININQTFTIETYHETRSVYQYKLEHASQMMSPLETDQENRLFTELYNRHTQIMTSLVGHDMFPIVGKRDLVYYLCELISAKDFEYDNLYVEYYLDLSPGWQLDPENSLVGVTQSCAMNKDNIAHFSFPFEFHLCYTRDEERPDNFLRWPTLYLQVFSLDSWQRHRIEGYGFCQLSDVSGTTCVEINTWRPRGDGLSAEMNRFFIGGTPELKDLSYMKDPHDDGVSEGKLSKFYFKTQTTGSVILKINTLFQTKVTNTPEQQRRIKGKKTSRRAGDFNTAVDSLTHILDAFHRARKRMLAARSTLPTVT